MSTQTSPVVGLNLAQTFRFGMPVTIASWWPAEQVCERKYRTREGGGHLTRYTIPACPSDAKEPVLVVIADAMTHVYLGEKQYQEIPVPGGARTIANDIVQALGTKQFMASATACPGVWVCAGDQPTPEESKTWRRRQEEYANTCAKMADEYHFTKQGAEISTLFRAMAEWLGLDPRNHPWMRDTRRGEVKPCPYCRKQIDSESIKCGECGEIVDVAAYNAMKRTLAEPSFVDLKLAEAMPAEPLEPVAVPAAPAKPGTILTPPLAVKK